MNAAKSAGRHAQNDDPMSIHASITVHSNSSRKKTRVLKAHIWNDRTGTAERGNYRYRVRTGGTNREGGITGFDRSTPNGAAVLARKAIEHATAGWAPITMAFDDLLVLLRAAWSGQNGTRMGILAKAIDHWYHQLTPAQRQEVFTYLSQEKERDERHQRLLARYDPALQCRVVTVYQGQREVHDAYHFADEYWVGSSIRINKEHIVEPAAVTREQP